MNHGAVTVGLVVVVALGLAVGGVSASEDGDVVTIHVGEDATFEKAEWSIAVSDEEYDERASMYGYGDVATEWADELVKEGLAAEAGQTEDEQTEDGWILHMELIDPDEDMLFGIDLEDDGDTVTISLTFEASGEGLTFIAEMPGEVVESNADDSADSSAIWYLDGGQSELTATAATGETDYGGDDDDGVTDDTGDGATDGEDDRSDDTSEPESGDDSSDDSGDEADDGDGDDASEGGDDDGMPGFGGVVALIGVLAGAMLLVRRP